MNMQLIVSSFAAGALLFKIPYIIYYKYKKKLDVSI